MESLESSVAFKPEHLGYIIHIFENTSNSRFHRWDTQKYKEVMEFVKKPLLCDEVVMQTNDIIAYGFLAQNVCKNTVTLLTQSRLISRADAVKMVVVLEEGRLPGQI